jgi:hypothetical protein
MYVYIYVYIKYTFLIAYFPDFGFWILYYNNPLYKLKQNKINDIIIIAIVAKRTIAKSIHDALYEVMKI